MANKKISELSSRTPALSDLMLVGDPSSGYSYKCTITALATIIETDIADGYVTIGTTQTVSGAKTFSNNLTLTSVPSSAIDTDKFLVLNSNVVNYRTGSQVLSDIGAADDTLVVHLAGTETITGYKTFSSFAGFDSAVSLKQNSTIVSQTGYSSIAASANGFFLTRAPGIHAFLNLADLTTTRNFTFPDVTGTLALTTDITNALTSYVPNTRTLTINGVTQSLAANRTFNVGTVETVNFTTGTTGTDVNVSGSPITTIGTITLNIPTASATNRGALSSTDWSTFNNKQSAITLTTTGSSGSATFVSNTLNVPTYTLAGLGGISGTGTTNYIPKFTSSSAIGNSVIYESGGSIGIGTTNPQSLLHIASAGNTFSIIDGGASSNTGLSFYKGGSAAGAIYYLGASDAMRFDVNNTERLRISSTGNVSIGNTNNTYKLDVTGDARINNLLWFTPSSGLMALGANGTNFEIYNGAGAETRLTLTNSGNLGLGTSSPASNLQVAAASSPTISMNLTGSATSGSRGDLSWYNSSISTVAIIRATAVTDNVGTQLEFHTRPAAGSLTQRMTLDASGNLGLGVTPSAWWSGARSMQIGLGGSIAARTSSDYAAVELSANQIINASAQRVYIGTGFASLYEQFDGAHKWLNAPSGTAGNAISFTQAMTLDASGRLAIGGTTVTDNTILNIQGSSAVSNVGIVLNKKNATARIYGIINQGTLDIYDYTASAYRLRITETGNVGIGTTSPAYKLDITGQGRFTQGLISEQVININRTKSGTGVESLNVIDARIYGTNAIGDAINIAFLNNSGINIANISGILGGDNVAYGSLAFSTRNYFTDNMVEVMRINNRGNVGIGTTSPSSKLQVSSTSAGAATVAAFLLNESTNTNTEVRLAFAANTNNDIATDRYSYISAINTSGSNGQALKFATNESGASAVERMRITSGGNVGIGTTSPTSALDVNGNAALTANFNYSSSGTYVRWQNNGTSFGDVGSAGQLVSGGSTNDFAIHARSTYNMVFATNFTERMRITSGGEVLIGTTSDAGDYKLQVNGNIYSTAFIKASTYLEAYDGTRDIYVNSAADLGLGALPAVVVASNHGLQFATNNGLAMYITSTKNVEIPNGSIKTAAPSGGTAKPIKFGEAGVTLGGSNTSGVRVEIDGVVYYLVTGYLP